MRKTTAVPYDWNVLCMVCREKIKASTSVRRWDGLIVGADHAGCFEYRSPLDMPAPPLRDQRPLPYTSPEPPDDSTLSGTISTVSVGASPFTYIAGSIAETLTLTGTITGVIVNGQFVGTPLNLKVQALSKVIISYTGTITMTAMPNSNYSNTVASIG